jgi:hypothetical protein
MAQQQNQVYFGEPQSIVDAWRDLVSGENPKELSRRCSITSNGGVDVRREPSHASRNDGDSADYHPWRATLGQSGGQRCERLLEQSLTLFGLAWHYARF